MGIRDTINEKPVIAYGGFGVLLLIAIGILFYVLKGGPKAAPLDKPIGDQAFYSDDDGAHWFADSLQKATPFKHDGKEAVRAIVYRCSDGKLFAAFLVRHTEAGRLQKGMMLEINNRPSYADHALTELKKPGAKDWIPVDGKNLAKVAQSTSVTCKTNPNDVPQLVFPGQE